MPTPLQLNDDEMSVLMSLAEQIDQQRRPQFLQEVAAELEAKRQAGEIGEGSVHRLVRQAIFRPAAAAERLPARSGLAGDLTFATLRYHYAGLRRKQCGASWCTW